MQTDEAFQAFSQLGPNEILDALESAGWRGDGRVHALNSYENRVYQVGLEDGGWIVAKFYRPARWPDETIIEEHTYSQTLRDTDIPVICPLQSPEQGGTLLRWRHYRFCVYPRAGGRAPELDNPEQLEVIGRTIARCHAVGQLCAFEHRPELSVRRFGTEAANAVLEQNLLPAELLPVYRSLIDDLLPVLERAFEQTEYRPCRIHGDFHPGNILWGADDTPHILDLDDCCNGPAIQDLWMFLSGDRAYRTERLADLLEGYTQFHEFNPAELALIEPLRTLRLIHYAAWITRRWEDPAFKQAFPFFATARFWDEHVLSLREQAAALQEAPLVWD